MFYGLLTAIVSGIIMALVTNRNTVVSPDQRNITFEYSSFLRRFMRFSMVFSGICLRIAVYYGIKDHYDGAWIMGVVLGLLFAGSTYSYVLFSNKSGMIMKGNLFTSDFRGRESMHAIEDVVSVINDPSKGIIVNFSDGSSYNIDRFMSNNKALLNYFVKKGISVKDKSGKPYNG